MNNKKKLKFLSQSVLLEEGGLPQTNTVIIIVVFLMLALFIVWAATMKMDVVTSATGIIQKESSGNSDYSLKALIPSGEIGTIQEGLSVSINIIGLTNKKPITGTIESVGNTPIFDSIGNIYYEAILMPDNDNSIENIKEHLVPEMETSVDIVTGRQTLLKYLFGPIYKKIDDAM